MQDAAAAKQYERAARLRDEIAALKKLKMRGDVDKDVQPHVFQIDPKKGLRGLQKTLGLRAAPRSIEGMCLWRRGDWRESTRRAGADEGGFTLG